MIDDRKAHQRVEHERDVATYNELAMKDRLQRQQEEAENMRRKEQFRQEAAAHWDETRRLKAAQKERRRGLK